MEVFAHRLLSELIAGAGHRLVTHYDLDKSVLPEAQYAVVFSEENTRIHFENEAIKVDRPLSKDIILVGSLSFDESIASYSMPINRDVVIDDKPVVIRTHDAMVKITSVIRITLITDNEVPKQARAQLRYMNQFVIQAFMNPPTQNWQEWPAHITGFTSTVNVPMSNILGLEEEQLIGKSFGVKMEENVVRSEHLFLQKV